MGGAWGFFPYEAMDYKAAQACLDRRAAAGWVLKKGILPSGTGPGSSVARSSSNSSLQIIQISPSSYPYSSPPHRAQVPAGGRSCTSSRLA